MTGPVDGVEEEDGAAFLFAFVERLVQTFIAMFRGTPDVVFDAAMNVVFRVGFYDKESKGRKE